MLLAVIFAPQGMRVQEGWINDILLIYDIPCRCPHYNLLRYAGCNPSVVGYQAEKECYFALRHDCQQ